MVTITGKVNHPSWKKRKRSKRKVSKPFVKSPDAILRETKQDYRKAVAVMDAYTKEELKAKRKAKEARKAAKEKARIERNHLDSSTDTLAAFGETVSKARPIPEQLKALKRQKMRLQFKIDRIISKNGVRKSEFGPMRTTALTDALKGLQGASFEVKQAKLKDELKKGSVLEGNETLVSYTSTISADEKARLLKIQAAMRQCEFNIWKLEELERNPQFNRNTVKRERHYQADKGKQVSLPIGNRERLDKSKPSANNWRKEMEARAIARILYKEGPKDDNMNAFNLALKAYERLPESEKARVLLMRNEYLKEVAK